jgi:anti-sigma factor RsiW
VSTNAYICETENIAAYIDGELEPSRRAALEEHLKQCADCAADLQAQRVFMCELDSALTSPFELAVPPNFAKVVAVRAESDMRGVRDASEHKRALRFCIVLGLAAFALLGVAASKAVLLNVRGMAGKVVGVLGFFAKTTADAASGLTVMSRVAGQGLVIDSRLVGIAGLFVVVLAIAVLSFLISRYHRTRLID